MPHVESKVTEQWYRQMSTWQFMTSSCKTSLPSTTIAEDIFHVRQTHQTRHDDRLFNQLLVALNFDAQCLFLNLTFWKKNQKPNLTPNPKGQQSTKKGAQIQITITDKIINSRSATKPNPLGIVNKIKEKWNQQTWLWAYFINLYGCWTN